MRTNYIYSIFTKFFGNDMPKEVQLRFQHWFLQTEDSLEKEKALHKIWDGIEVKADEKTRRKYAKLNARIDLAEGNRKYFAVKLAVVAAMFLLMLGSAWMAWNMKDIQDEESFYIVEAPLGEKSKLTLPDGTVVWLNAGSQLRYSSHFNKNNRDVTLEGEGYFDVKGTVFNVKAYPEDPTMEVRLYEGSVCLSTPSVREEDGIYMEPGEKVHYNKMNKTTRKEKLLYQDDLSWKDGYYHFADNSLKEIAAELERIFNVRIKIEDDDIEKYRYHISFVNHEVLPDMLDAINNDKKLIITYNKDTIEIRKRR